MAGGRKALSFATILRGLIGLILVVALLIVSQGGGTPSQFFTDLDSRLFSGFLLNSQPSTSPFELFTPTDPVPLTLQQQQLLRMQRAQFPAFNPDGSILSIRSPIALDRRKARGDHNNSDDGDGDAAGAMRVGKREASSPPRLLIVDSLHLIDWAIRSDDSEPMMPRTAESRLIEELSVLTSSGTLAKGSKDVLVIVFYCLSHYYTGADDTACGGGGSSQRLFHAVGSSLLSRIEAALGVKCFMWFSRASRLAVRTKQALFRAAAEFLGAPAASEEGAAPLNDQDGGGGLATLMHQSSITPLSPVAVVDVDDVLLCGDAFEGFNMGAPLLQLITFRDETESRKARAGAWYEQAVTRALGLNIFPTELFGQPTVSHRFVGASQLRVLQSFLNDVARESFHVRDGESIAPTLLYVAVLRYREHVHSLSSVEHQRAGLFIDANASVCNDLYQSNGVCAANILAIVERNDCADRPVNRVPEVGDVRKNDHGDDVVVSSSSSCEFMVPADAIVVDKTPPMAMNTFLDRVRDRSLKDFLVSARGHYDGEKKRRAANVVAVTSTTTTAASCGGEKDDEIDGIIAYATGYQKRSTIAPLLNSFTAFHRPRCTKLFLFVYRVDMEVWSKEHSDVIPVAADEFRNQLLTSRCKLNKQRKEVIYRWLRAVGMQQYRMRYILMVDSRDVFFQADPFIFIRELHAAMPPHPSPPSVSTGEFVFFPPESAYFGESEWSFRGGFEYNAKWVEVAFGSPFVTYMWNHSLRPLAHIALDKSNDTSSVTYSQIRRPEDEALFTAAARNAKLSVSPMPIACGGIYGGTATAVLDFLKLLFKLMSVKPDKQDCYNDQGVMNGLLAGGFGAAHYPHDVVVTNPDTTVFTHRPGRGKMRWDAGGRLVNCRGMPYAVVHQLDRFPRLWEALLNGTRASGG